MAKLPKLTRSIVGPPIRRILISGSPIYTGSFSGAVRTLLASRFRVPVVSAEADQLAFAVDDDKWGDLRPATLLGFLQPVQSAADECSFVVEDDAWIPLRATAIGPQPVVVFTDTDEGVQLTNFGLDDFSSVDGPLLSPWTLQLSPVVYNREDQIESQPAFDDDRYNPLVFRYRPFPITFYLFEHDDANALVVLLPTSAAAGYVRVVKVDAWPKAVVYLDSDDLPIPAAPFVGVNPPRHLPMMGVGR